MELGRAHTAGDDEDWIRELDDGEVAQVLEVDAMACDAEEAEAERKAVDCEEEEVQEDDEVDEAGEEFLRKDGVLFD